MGSHKQPTAKCVMLEFYPLQIFMCVSVREVKMRENHTKCVRLGSPELDSSSKWIYAIWKPWVCWNSVLATLGHHSNGPRVSKSCRSSDLLSNYYLDASICSLVIKLPCKCNYYVTYQCYSLHMFICSWVCWNSVLATLGHHSNGPRVSKSCRSSDLLSNYYLDASICSLVIKLPCKFNYYVTYQCYSLQI